jgi:uncharacterized protein (TIGR00369 family)
MPASHRWAGEATETERIDGGFMADQGGVAERDQLCEDTVDGIAEHDLGPGAGRESHGARVTASLNPARVVCGRENPCGLHLEFETDGDATMAQWTASAGWESFKGVIHGGVICAVLDEAMSQAIIAAGYEALTAEMRVRFRKKVSVNDVLRVRGWVVRVQKRKIVAEGSLTSASGVERAHAWATFLATAKS